MLHPEHIRERRRTCNCHKLGMLLHGENIVAINDGRMTSNNVMDIAAAPVVGGLAVVGVVVGGVGGGV